MRVHYLAHPVCVLVKFSLPPLFCHPAEVYLLLYFFYTARNLHYNKFLFHREILIQHSDSDRAFLYTSWPKSDIIVDLKDV